MKKGLYITLIVVLLAAFCGSALYLGRYFVESKKQSDRYNQLSEIVEDARTESEATEEATEATKPQKKPSDEGGFIPGYKDLFEQNNDMVGWIRIENTVIDYPVMQTKIDNPNYYLYRNFDEKDATQGSIYIREECDIYEPTDNITIYGHNMRDGSMFASLLNYYDKEVWEDNSLIFFDNLFESHVYKIFAVFKTSANIGEGFQYHDFINAADRQDFDDFISTCKRLAFYDTGITPVYGDKVICLSTCEYTLNNGRFVVAAVRIT